jgi:HPt (histidine-containing phosphotransfer) domain-containing protein
MGAAIAAVNYAARARPETQPAAAAHLPSIGRARVKLAGNTRDRRAREVGMVQLASKIVDPASAVSAAAAIDRGQLARMTYGDRNLEREVLQLFDRQAGLLLARMRDREPATVATLAHTLKGSASSIGAAAVMRAAAAVEQAVSANECERAIERLATAIDEARAAIAELLGGQG